MRCGKNAGASLVALSLAAMLTLSVPARVQAGPYADFERALANAYAPYRAALMQTNQKDRTGTEASLSAFEGRWSDLMRTWRTSPPPQYADDPRWLETVSSVEKTMAAAKAAVTAGDLAKAHNVLERIRDELGKLRARNGVVTFSDRMDAYHEHMEHVLMSKLPGADADGTARLREEAAVLVHLAGLVATHAPPALAKDAAFNEGLAALKGSAETLLSAARRGDRPAIEQAMKALKPAYARLFVKYG
jgi:hypothetical protein